MKFLHFDNGGVIGPARAAGNLSGAWKIGPRGLPLSQGATAISTALSFPSPTSQGSREYYFASRKMTLFYDDMYGTTSHITLTSVANSYTDVRHMANDDGAGDGSNTCLASYSGSYVGYKFDLPIIINGWRAYGSYAGIPLSGQGNLTVETWDGTTWTVRSVFVNGGSSINDSAPGLTVTFGLPVLARGIRIKHTTTSTYCPWSFFVGLDLSGNSILGVQ